MMAIDAIMRPVEASLRKASRTSARGTFVSVLVVDVNVGSLQIRDSEKGDLQKQGLELEALPHLWRGKAADRVAICCILHASRRLTVLPWQFSCGDHPWHTARIHRVLYSTQTHKINALCSLLPF